MSDRMRTTRQRRRLGEWLPNSEEAIARFRLDLAKHAGERQGRVPMTPVVHDLSLLLNGDPRVADGPDQRN
ncbi:phosphatidylserine decarboxylase [Paraburkholderia steynii]|uniref:Phosphatidylserine decarboxylase n=1 Tax=Paraburkholderia steynii TaxID=1245441 RepID=A0A7Z7BKR6_9BURK|nr:phosphatidylserine decarboxylase [Paraburkholderia steynii]